MIRPSTSRTTSGSPPRCSSRGRYGYFAGGAGDERTLRDNVEAFARWRLRPRVLVDVGDVSTATTRARHASSRCPCSSRRSRSSASRTPTASGDGAGGGGGGDGRCACRRSPPRARARSPRRRRAAPRWFQLYCFRDRGVTRAFIDEAVECGFGRSRSPSTLRTPGAGSATFAPASRCRRTSPCRAVAAAVGGGAADDAVHEVFEPRRPVARLGRRRGAGRGLLGCRCSSRAS